MKCNNCGREFSFPLIWVAPLTVECQHCKSRNVLKSSDISTIDLSMVSDDELLAEIKKRGL